MTQKKLTFKEKLELVEALKQVYRDVESSMYFCMVSIENADGETAYRSYTEDDSSYWKEWKKKEDIYRAILEFLEDMI